MTILAERFGQICRLLSIKQELTKTSWFGLGYRAFRSLIKAHLFGGQTRFCGREVRVTVAY